MVACKMVFGARWGICSSVICRFFNQNAIDRSNQCIIYLMSFFYFFYRKYLSYIKILALQVAIIRPLLLFIAAILWTDGKYVQGEVVISIICDLSVSARSLTEVQLSYIDNV